MMSIWIHLIVTGGLRLTLYCIRSVHIEMSSQKDNKVLRHIYKAKLVETAKQSRVLPSRRRT